jgi:hypothetical protein
MAPFTRSVRQGCIWFRYDPVTRRLSVMTR